MGKLKKLAVKYKAHKLKDNVKHYLGIYEDWFLSRRKEGLNLLEIGVFKGGSVKMWKKYFPNANIYGIDINERCKRFEKDRVKIFIGDQTDKVFLKNVIEQSPPLDVIIDDGGHTMEQQKTSFDYLFKWLADGGVYIIEDLHTSYNSRYGGGKEDSTIEMLKGLVDGLQYGILKVAINERIKKVEEPVSYLDKHIESIHFYKSIVFITKK